MFIKAFKMDCVNKILILLAISTIISTIVSSIYIPSTSGTIPQGESPEDFSNSQQQMVYNSIPFKSTMAFTGITIILFIIIIYRGYLIEERIELKYKTVKSILKVNRSQIIPTEKLSSLNVQPRPLPIEVVVEDPKPTVKTTPQLSSTIAPNSSPPIQLVPDTLENLVEYKVPRLMGMGRPNPRVQVRPSIQMVTPRPLSILKNMPQPRGPVIQVLPRFKYTPQYSTIINRE